MYNYFPSHPREEILPRVSRYQQAVKKGIGVGVGGGGENGGGDTSLAICVFFCVFPDFSYVCINDLSFPLQL